ncbi:MAG: hypothetical protein ACE5G0_14500 [Rhodothermales bacterium]
MNIPDCEVEVTVLVRAGAPLIVDDVPTALSDLTQSIEEATVGKRARVEVIVQSPLEKSQDYVEYVRAVQGKVREAKSPVVVGYHIVAAESAG